MNKSNTHAAALLVSISLLLTGCISKPINENVNFSQENASVSEAAVTVADTTAASSSEANVTAAANTTAAAKENAMRHKEEKENDFLPKYADFFLEDKVHEIDITYPEGDWENVQYTAGNEQYHKADVTIDGEKFEEVGVRTKGNSSLYMATKQSSTRYPFHIKFDEYTDGQSFYGLDDLVLNNSTDDASYLREYLAYSSFRELGMNAPYVTFFRTYINGELHGLYVGVEVVDSSYLERTFDSHKGSLYKASVGATLETWMPMYTMEAKKGAPDDKSDLAEFIRVLNETPVGSQGELENYLDVESVLKYFAVCAVVHDWDDYCGHFSQNYYLYKSNGVFHLIPWDMNESFLQTQSYYAHSDGSEQDIINPVTGDATLEKRPLAQKLLSVPKYYQKYLSYCRELSGWLDEVDEYRLSELKTLIDEDVKNDPTAFFTYAEFEKQFVTDNRSGIAGFIKLRAEYVPMRVSELEQENFENFKCIELEKQYKN